MRLALMVWIALVGPGLAQSNTLPSSQPHPPPEIQSQPSPGFSFATRILPILTHAGCNAGACHGAATGQGGFKLSLLGYDPESDYQAITRELGGRRVELGAPDRSLILRKPTRQLDHEGGRRIQLDSEAYRDLLAWIQAGTPYGSRNLRVIRIKVSPAELLLLKRGQSYPLQVHAYLSDGSVEDVTGQTLYSSYDDGLVEVDRAGVITARRPGVTAVMIRYLGQVAAVRAGAPYQDREHSFRTPPAANFIDELTQAEWRRLRLTASSPADVTTLFRRLHLDIAGRLPTPAEIRQFQAQPSRERSRGQATVVDQLLGSPDFVDFWTAKLGDWLLLNSKKLGDRGARSYHEWLRRQVAGNVGLDRVAYELLTAQGEATENGPVNFHRFASDPRDQSEFVGQALLGTRVACARCHNHPFDRWTMEDYHRFAAYFARTGFDKDRLVQRPTGEVQHPKTGKDLDPRPLGGLDQTAEPSADRRVALARWVIAPDNPFFARAMVNRVWKELMGRGLVEPADDLRPSNPASIPGLLDALAARFVEDGYDLRRLIRLIASSSTYALSSQANAVNRLDDRYFSRSYPKPLSAQVLADAIAQATGVPDEFPGYTVGTRAVTLLDPQVPSYSLDVFGRCPRTTPCDPAVTPGGGLAQALHLVNGPAINAKAPATIERLMKQTTTDRARVEELYLRVVGRPPTNRELRHWEQCLSRAASKQDELEDLLWALLNSREFAFNH